MPGEDLFGTEGSAGPMPENGYPTEVPVGEVIVSMIVHNGDLYVATRNRVWVYVASVHHDPVFRAVPFDWAPEGSP